MGPMSAAEETDLSFERKDEIRQRLRVILRQTTPKQKSRLLYNLVGLPKKGFHCRTREELQRLDSFLRAHFPAEVGAGAPIPLLAMENKLRELDGGKPSESVSTAGRRGALGGCHSHFCSRGGVGPSAAVPRPISRSLWGLNTVGGRRCPDVCNEWR